MPGGALVSAPLVEQTRCDTQLAAGDKNLINYWFRHIWEVSWPLYPPILLAASSLRVSLVSLCLSQVALTLFLALLGYVFILRPVPRGADSTRLEIPGLSRLGRAIVPFVVLIGGMPLLGMAIERVAGSDLGGLGSQLGMSAALVVAIVVALAVDRGGPQLLGRALQEKATWTLLILALGVKIFGGMVKATGAAQGTAEVFHDAGLPTLLGVALVPFFVGFVSGASIAFVAVAFPVVIAMIHEGSSPLPGLLPIMGFAYAMGFVGYMLSPVHMCLVLSSRFFKEDLGGAYRRMALPLALFAGAAATILLVAAALGG
jgi:integral membrane protein (TIGR00529 family)